MVDRGRTTDPGSTLKSAGEGREGNEKVEAVEDGALKPSSARGELVGGGATQDAIEGVDGGIGDVAESECVLVGGFGDVGDFGAELGGVEMEFGFARLAFAMGGLSFRGQAARVLTHRGRHWFCWGLKRSRR